MNLKYLAIRIAAVIALAIFAFSCNKDEHNDEYGPTQKEFLIFGEYAGFCGGESCIEIFKLEDGKLYEDTKDHYPSTQTTGYQGDYILLDKEKYEMVKDLIDAFPEKLKEDVNLVIGMPDAYDQGGIYVEIKENDKSYYWLIDRDTNNIPAYLHGWVNLIRERIAQVNN